MQNIGIIYYTGTNNTKYLTDYLISRLKDNYTLYIHNIFENNISFQNIDLLIILYPIYAFNAPKYLEKKLKQINISNIPYLIIKNSGEALNLNNSSSHRIKSIMKHKNNTFISEHHLLMPYYIITSQSNELIKKMLLTNQFIINNISNNLFYKIKINQTIPSKIFCFFGKLQRFGAKLNSHFYKLDSSKCISCKKCENNCPINCLKIIDTKIKVNNKCLMCMKCSTICPTKAIKIGFLNHWQVQKNYNYSEILNNDSIDENIWSETNHFLIKSYTKYFNKY